MNRKIILAVGGLAFASGLLFLARRVQQPLEQETRGLIRARPPVVEPICVESIQNLSKQPVNMDGIDDELVAQLQKAGYQSRKISAADSKPCASMVNAELVELSGRGRKTARVDFRLTLAGEQPPRLSASAEGKSAGDSAPSVTAPVEREAIVAAFGQQAHQIDVAYKSGLPPWLPPGQGQ